MADAVRCDRCHEYQDGAFVSSKLRRVRVFRYRWRNLGRGLDESYDGGRPEWKNLDLCKDCSRGLDAYLSGWEVVEHEH